MYLLLPDVRSDPHKTFHPSSSLITSAENWCQAQETQCPLICLQYPGNSASTLSNTCDPTALSYSCVCSNGMSPNASQYSQTLPYFVCTEWGNECVTACGSNSQCASDCRSQHPCGAQDPVRQNTSTLSSTMSKTATGAPAGATTGASGTIYTGFGGAAATSSGAGSTGSSSSTSGAAMALEMGQAYGLVMLATGLFGGFALML